jgi:hypothetical protein
LTVLKKNRFFILLMTFLQSALLLGAQDLWKLKLDKEGIKIYASPYADSKIKAIRVVCTLEATLSQMAAVLLDIKSQDEWFYHTKSTVLKQVSPSELFYTVEFTLFADPAGSIPIWLINLFSIYGPFETFKKLKTQLKKAQYINVHLPFIEN